MPKEFCVNGHPRTPENLRPGRYDCAVCHREQQLARDPEAKARYDAWRKVNPERARKYARDQQRARHASRTPEGKEYIVMLRRDPCSYCGGPGGSIDHIVPVARGGLNDWENLTGACSSCNVKKRDRKLLLFMLAQSSV